MSAGSDTTPGWMTTTQAAKALGKCTATVWSWVKSGAIPGQYLTKIGNRNYISRAWVKGFMP